MRAAYGSSSSSSIFTAAYEKVLVKLPFTTKKVCASRPTKKLIKYGLLSGEKPLGRKLSGRNAFKHVDPQQVTFNIIPDQENTIKQNHGGIPR